MTSVSAKRAATIALTLLAVSAASLGFGQTLPEGDLPQPKLIIVDKPLTDDQVQAAILSLPNLHIEDNLTLTRQFRIVQP